MKPSTQVIDIPTDFDTEALTTDRSGTFYHGQRVRIKDAGAKVNNYKGAIMEHDALEDTLAILLDESQKPRGTELVPVIINGERLVYCDAKKVVVLDDHPDSWLRYQVPGDEQKWAYLNSVTRETRWEPPGTATMEEVPRMLPTCARAFMFHVVDQHGSVTRGYGKICECASQMRPHGTACLTSGATMDRQDFVIACLELNLVHDDSAKIAGDIFDGIDLDGNHLGGDKMLTVADFHEADEAYHSVASGAFGHAEVPLGLLLFFPELVPARFHRDREARGYAPPVITSPKVSRNRAQDRYHLGIAPMETTLALFG